MTITTTRALLTGSWAADVDTLETAIKRLGADRSLANDTRVACFEVADDPDLHVNITHKHQTRTVRGWAGPASVPNGFVHNRTFADAEVSRIIRQVRDMIFAART